MTDKTPTKKTKSQQIGGDVVALLRARNPIIWIVTKEEARSERFLAEAALAAGYVPHTWDAAQGVADMQGKIEEDIGGLDISDTLNAIEARAKKEDGQERDVWIMRDLPPWITGPMGIVTLRKLRNLARLLPTAPQRRAQAIVVLTTSADIPPELSCHATVIEWPLPDRDEIASILDAALKVLPEDLQKKAAPNGTRDAAIDAAVGLSGEEAAACYARSLVQKRAIDPQIVANEKKRVIAREGVLEWYDPIPGGLDAVGGLDLLKNWLVARKSAYTSKARQYGLPAPKGALLVGISGCGKSLTAKAISTAWGIPLLRLDLGALKSKFVGESETNLRKAIEVIEAIGRCVVWIDEIEKAMQGATSGSADGGVSADALGTILSWMQERQGEAFVIATANDITGLPPELLRKGRFDEIWFIDLPNPEERVAVLQAALRQHNRQGVDIDASKVAAACDKFTGAEIAAIVPDALFTAFADDAREITTADLVNAAKTVVPLSRTADAKIEGLRNWAKTKARPATSPYTAKQGQTQPLGRQIDI